MVNRVNPFQRKEPEEIQRNSFASRFSFSLNWTQVMTITAIFFIIMMPFVAAAAAPLVPRPSGDIQSWNNKTCPAGPVNPIMVKAYLESGKLEKSSQYELEAEMLHEDPWGRSNIKEKLWIQASNDYLEQAQNFDHPADKAVYLHLAISVLKNDSARDIKHEEVHYCQEAALIARTPEEQLAWISRGFQELGITHVDPQTSKLCLFEEEKTKCRLMSSLWHIAGNVLLNLPPEAEVRFKDIVDIKELSPPFTTTTFAAVQCFYNAAYSLQIDPSQDPVRLNLYERSLNLLRSINTSNIHLHTIAKLERTYTDICIRAWNVEKWKNTPKEKELIQRTHDSAMVSQKIYEKLMKENHGKSSFYSIKRARALMIGASFSKNLKQKIELYTQAQDLVENAWKKDRTTCLNMPDFYDAQNQDVFSIDNSLLGILPRLIQKAQNDYRKQTSPSSFWNFLKRFI